MKLPLFTLAAVHLMFSGTIFAQNDVPLEYLKDIYSEASVVARVDVQETVPIGGDGYYYEFIASGRIVEPLKGSIRRGQLLKFYVRAEYGYDHKRMRGDQITFLTRVFNRKTREYGPFHELPDGNCTFPYSSELAANVRKLKFASRHKGNKPK